MRSGDAPKVLSEVIDPWLNLKPWLGKFTHPPLIFTVGKKVQNLASIFDLNRL